MAAETVKFYLTDQDDYPILGVLVRVFDETGTVFVTQDTTVDVDGEAVAEVTLDGDDPPNYATIRMSKTGVAFDGSLGFFSKSPQLISIYSPPTEAPSGTNNFDIKGETFTRPVSADPRLCRCSGFFKDATGRPLPNLEMSFINQFKPSIVDGNAVLGSKVELRTDEDGYAQLDLYRGAEYLVMVQSIEAAAASETSAVAFPREVVIPSQSSANLVDLLFPIVTEIVFAPATLTVAEGDTLDVTAIVTASDGRVLADIGYEDVLYSTEDESVAVVGITQNKLVISGIASGTTNLLAVRKDQTIVKIPDTDIVGVPLLITVT
jgi:uncharacterized protein YjdB